MILGFFWGFIFCTNSVIILDLDPCLSTLFSFVYLDFSLAICVFLAFGHVFSIKVFYAVTNFSENRYSQSIDRLIHCTFYFLF